MLRRSIFYPEGAGPPPAPLFIDQFRLTAATAAFVKFLQRSKISLAFLRCGTYI
jgi:hypothetical protein